MGLGDKLNQLKNEHGDQINKAIDDAQAQHSDKLGAHADKVNKVVDQAQEKLLGKQDGPANK